MNKSNGLISDFFVQVDETCRWVFITPLDFPCFIHSALQLGNFAAMFLSLIIFMQTLQNIFLVGQLKAHVDVLGSIRAALILGFLAVTGLFYSQTVQIDPLTVNVLLELAPLIGGVMLLTDFSNRRENLWEARVLTAFLMLITGMSWLRARVFANIQGTAGSLLDERTVLLMGLLSHVLACVLFFSSWRWTPPDHFRYNDDSRVKRGFYHYIRSTSASFLTILTYVWIFPTMFILNNDINSLHRVVRDYLVINWERPRFYYSQTDGKTSVPLSKLFKLCIVDGVYVMMILAGATVLETFYPISLRAAVSSEYSNFTFLSNIMTVSVLLFSRDVAGALWGYRFSTVNCCISTHFVTNLVAITAQKASSIDPARFMVLLQQDAIGGVSGKFSRCLASTRSLFLLLGTFYYMISGVSDSVLPFVVFISLASLGINSYSIKMGLKHQQLLRKYSGTKLNVFQKYVKGMETYQSFNLEKYFCEEFMGAIKMQLHEMKVMSLIGNIFGLMTGILGWAAQVAVVFLPLLFGASNVAESFLVDTFVVQMLGFHFDNFAGTAGAFLFLRDSYNRIAKYQKKCRDSVPVGRTTIRKQLTSNAVACSDCTFRVSNAFILRVCQLKMQPGDCLLVSGTNGCGKTSFCYALLGELEVLSGSIEVDSRIAFASQDPWIMNATLRENIVLDREVSDAQFQRAVELSALTADVGRLEAGADEVILSGGTNLSGGQQKRLGIARCIARDAKLLILDDPFSGLDHKSLGLCLKSLEAWSGGAVVMTSPIVLDSSPTTRTGILVNGTLQLSAVHESATQAPRGGAQDEQADEGSGQEGGDAGGGKPKTKKSEMASQTEDDGLSSRENLFGALRNVIGVPALLLYLLLFLGSVASSTVSFYCLILADPASVEGDTFITYVQLYFAFALLELVFNFVAYLILQSLVLRSLTALMVRMSHVCGYAPAHILHKYKSRIIQIITGDMGGVFGTLGTSLRFMYMFAEVFSAPFVVSSLSVMVLAILAVLVVFIMLLSVWLKRVMDRLIIANKPLGAQFISSSEHFGFNSISMQAFDVGGHLVCAHAKLLATLKAYSGVGGTLGNLKGITVSTMVGITNALIAIQISYFPNPVAYMPMFSLLYTYCYGSLLGVARIFDAFNGLTGNMVSMKRFELLFGMVEEDYMNSSEAKAQGTVDKLVKHVPGLPPLKVSNVVVSYGSTEVLHGISLTIQEGDIVGIVGHSGSGKSTLINSILGFVPIDSGTIEMYGQKLGDCTLGSWRASIAFSPQKSHTYFDTIRQELDPQNVHTDAEIWKVLRSCAIAREISSIPDQLQGKVEALAGAKVKMLCNARFLLRAPTSSVAILDEPTSALGEYESKLFSAILNHKALHATILIAHRLETLSSASFVVELSGGNVVRQAAPEEFINEVFY